MRRRTTTGAEPAARAWRRPLAVTAACGVALRLNAQMTWPGMACAFFWMAPWLAMVDRLRTRRAALLAGVAMSVAYVAAVFPWFPPSIVRYTGWPPLAAWAVFLALAPFLEPQVVLVPVVRRVLVARGLAWPLRGLGTAAAWVALEWLSPKLFGDTLAHGLYGARWLRQGADVGVAAGL
jgi:apolipoprotein N-acyltransferase